MLPVWVINEWVIRELIGFTYRLDGLLVAVSDVAFYLDENGEQTEVNNLVLGVMRDDKSFDLVLKDDALIELVGEQYIWPKYTDRPKGGVVKLY